MNRSAAAIGTALALAVTVAGTAATQALAQDASPDPIKLAVCWLLLGAFIGRIYYNIKTPRPLPPPAT